MVAKAPAWSMTSTVRPAQASTGFDCRFEADPIVLSQRLVGRAAAAVPGGLTSPEVLVNAGHHALAELDDATYEAMLARIAWREWAHALSVVRATADDVAASPVASLTAVSSHAGDPRTAAGDTTTDSQTHESKIQARASPPPNRGPTGRVGRHRPTRALSH